MAHKMTMITDDNMNGGSDCGGDSGELIRLYVKAGADGQRYGACPFCQRVFMLLMLKSSRHPHLKFKVATVNLAKPPEEFRQLGLRHVPALVHSAALIAYDNVDDIIQYLDEVFPDELLQLDDDPLAENACKNVFSKFCFFIKEVSKDPTNSLLTELTKLDTFLERRHAIGNGVYVSGTQQLSQLDCELLPKLQHLRVASAILRGFQLPVRLTAIWRYLHAAYSDDIFVKSCPSDQEIVLHWVDKPGTPKLSFDKHAALTNETSKYSFDVPAIAKPINIS